MEPAGRREHAWLAPIRRQIDVSIVCVCFSLGINDPAIAEERAAPVAKIATHRSDVPPKDAIFMLDEDFSDAAARLNSPVPGDRSPLDLTIRLPYSEPWIPSTAARVNEENSSRYLPPQLADPDRPAGVSSWERDLPLRQQKAALGPAAHPVARSNLSTVCPAPPDPAWLSALKAEWALDGYGNAEPLAGQPSYLPFPCY